MKVLKLAVCVVALGAFAANASTTTQLMSKEDYTVGQGDLLVDFGFDLSIVRNGVDNESMGFTVGGNYFLTDILAPGIEFSIQHDVELVGTGVQFLPNLRAYWPLGGRILPYAMAGLGFLRVPGASLFNMAIGPGVDFMVSNTVALGIQLRYDLGAGNGTFHRIKFPLHFSLYFGW